KIRGWTLPRLGLIPGWIDILSGVGLFVATYGAYVVLWFVVGTFWPGFYEVAERTHLVASGIPLLITIVVSVVNPIYEEVFVSGYVISALGEKIGATAAVNVRAGIRLAYHLYQGVVGVLAVVPVGLIFGIWFRRTGRLWPLIIAHSLKDVLGL